MPEPTTPPVALRAERERTIQRLCDEFAQDHLEVAEFEQRLDLAHRALTVADLQALTADLAPAEPVATPAPAAQPTVAPAPPPAGGQRGHQLMVGIMGGATRRGRWSPAHETTAIAVMGGVLLDFREAALPPGETVVHAFAFWGGVSIVVPPGLEVAVNGIGIMGGFDHRGQTPNAPAPGAPRLRVDGVAIMGGVDVTVREHGEATDWDQGRAVKEHTHQARQELHAKRRELREEARRLRDEWRSGR